MAAETFLAAIAGVIFLVACAFVRPSTLHAPTGWYLEGVRVDGATTLRRTPPITCEDDCPDQPALPARIWCTSGQRPIVVDHRTVGCQRGGWR